MTDLLKLPHHSKIWIFQADKLLSEDLQKELIERTMKFLSSWQSHGQSMSTYLNIYHQVFLVVAVDESEHGASGCGIDKLVHFVKNMGNDLSVDFFNRSNIVIRDNHKLHFLKLKEIRTHGLLGLVSSESFIFNNAITTIGELSTSWMLPVEKSFIARYIKEKYI